ncbi:hypothetical protein B0O99DRAFT_629113 [Bisporella sp. PMI_857]|nr:hypothetical protein B0O99DRAFT_629113 [Bisporella sp. PMI_857]
MLFPCNVNFSSHNYTMGIQNQFKRMKRTGTLHDYFSSDRLRTPPKGSGFFDLSYSTRCSIYDFAGLTDRIVYLNFVDREYSDSHLSLSTDLEPLPQEEYLCEWSQSVSHFLHGHVPRSQIRLNGWLIDGCCDDLDFHCNCDPVPSHLLWVSPRLAHDASKAFFSRNRFYIHGAEAGGLSGLRSLNSTCLRWIKSLTINLNVDQEFESYSYKFASHESTYARPFWEAGESSGSNKKTKELRVCHDQKSLIHDWAALCHYLADFSLSKDLKLSLICNVVNLTVAEEITTQLLRLPILKDCAINLRSHGTDRALYRLSKKAALKVTGRSMNSFRRFLDLPNELQIKILEQTNIIAPHALAVIPGRRNSYLGKYIGFSRHSYMYFVQQIGWHYLYEGHYRERDWSRGYFQCCRKCSDTWFQACCCWTRHSAMSTTCVCWQPPSLLSVSHAMRRICEPLFYSKNYFVVLAEPPNDPRDKMSYELHHFLSSVSLAARQHLRLIRIALNLLIPLPHILTLRN